MGCDHTTCGFENKNAKWRGAEGEMANSKGGILVSR